jgi:hypothetical protein
MSILTDFVVAASYEGAAVSESANPADTWPTQQFKSVDTIKLCTLYCAIVGETYDGKLLALFPLVGGKQEEGPWVFRFPHIATQALADLQDSRIPKVAKDWAATEELEMDGWSYVDAAEVVSALSAHARLASSSQKALFLRLSL